VRASIALPSDAAIFSPSERRGANCLETSLTSTSALTREPPRSEDGGSGTRARHGAQTSAAGGTDQSLPGSVAGRRSPPEGGARMAWSPGFARDRAPARRAREATEAGRGYRDDAGRAARRRSDLPR